MAGNPFSPHAYDLDLTPNLAQAKVLRRIADGDRLVLDRDGRRFAWERGGPRPPAKLVDRLLDNQWVLPPCADGPLFGDDRDGRLTVRGEHALVRYRDITRT
jgi:hypothetical protein